MNQLMLPVVYCDFFSSKRGLVGITKTGILKELNSLVKQFVVAASTSIPAKVTPQDF